MNLAIQIATEIHGCDPAELDIKWQAQALRNAEQFGKEEYVSTLIALLPDELCEVAAEGWDRLAGCGIYI